MTGNGPNVIDSRLMKLGVLRDRSFVPFNTRFRFCSKTLSMFNESTSNFYIIEAGMHNPNFNHTFKCG